MKDDIERLGISINGLAARALVAETALQALLSLLDETAGRKFAVRFRERAAQAMQAVAPNLDPATDHQMTAAIYALLEAAGHPPTTS